MRFTILKDTLITAAEYKKLENEFSIFIKQHTGLTPRFFVQEQNFTKVPTESDRDGDLKPTTTYTTDLMSVVHAKYGQWGTDHVVMLVHRDNWIYKGIWGTNWSNLYYQYHVHLCRFDNKNIANSLGTLYHEWMHSLDALIKTHTGFDVTTLFNLSYDKYVVHGGRPDKENTTEWTYIKWKDNVRAMQLMAPHLKKAYAVREEMYLKPLTSVQLRVISWLRSILNKKDGVSPFINK